MSAQGEWLPRGMSAQKGCLPDSHLVNRITDICKNITLPHLYDMCVSEASEPAVRSGFRMWMCGPDKGRRNTGRVQTRGSNSRKACSRLERLTEQYFSAFREMRQHFMLAPALGGSSPLICRILDPPLN